MKPISLIWLLTTTMLFCLAASPLKKLVPSIFDNEISQITLYGSITTFTSIGLFLSLLCLFTKTEKRATAAWSSIGFLGIFTYYLCYIVANPLLLHASDKVALSDWDASEQMLDRSLRGLQEAKSVKGRENMAMAIYCLRGIPLYYMGENGESILYNPTQKDKEVWAKTLENRRQPKELISTLEQVSNGLTLLAIEFIGAFFLIFAAGIFYIAVRKSRMKQQEFSHPSAA